MQKVVTVRPHLAWAIIAGVKRFECRPGPPAGNMRPDGVRALPGARIDAGERVWIHASASIPGLRRHHTLFIGDYEITNDTLRGCKTPQYMLRGPNLAWPYRLPVGAIVGSIKVVEAIPVTHDTDYDAHWGRRYIYDDGGSSFLFDGGRGEVIADHREWGDWSYGWAWRLTNPQRLVSGCPACGTEPGGALVAEHFDTADPGATLEPCRLCSGLGSKGPVTVPGKQGVWCL